jgi:hypothetical protein
MRCCILMMRNIVCVFLSLFFLLQAKGAPFSLGSDAKLIYAFESIASSDIGLDGAVRIGSATDELNLQFQAGFAISQSSRYVRIEFENGSLLNSLPSTGLAANVNYTSLLSQGGNTGDSFAVIEVFAAASQPQDTELLVEVTALKILDRALPLTVKYSLYGSAADAVNNGSYLYRKEVDLLQFVPGLATGFVDAYALSLGFGTEFLRFNPTFRTPSTFSVGDSDGELASLAKFKGNFLILDNVRRPSDSAKINDFRDLLVGLNTSEKSVTMSGDFSSGDVSLNVSDNCAGAHYALTSDNFSKFTILSLDTLFTYPVLCIDLTGNTEPFSRTEFQLDLGLGLKPVYFGKISYDGSSVDFPFLSTFPNNKQKIFITNHAGYDVDYKFEFFAEESLKDNFQRGTASTGTIPAFGVVKIDTTELFNVSKGVPTRLSGRMLVDALPQDISAAIQIVSLSSNAPPVTNVLDVKQN